MVAEQTPRGERERKEREWPVICVTQEAPKQMSTETREFLLPGVHLRVGAPVLTGPGTRKTSVSS